MTTATDGKERQQGAVAIPVIPALGMKHQVQGFLHMPSPVSSAVTLSVTQVPASVQHHRPELEEPSPDTGEDKGEETQHKKQQAEIRF